jgi:hypothetical protein
MISRDAEEVQRLVGVPVPGPNPTTPSCEKHNLRRINLSHLSRKTLKKQRSGGMPMQFLLDSLAFED